jgi:hypothetical protein
VPSSAKRSKSDFVVSGPTILYGAEIGAGTGEKALPSLSVLSPVCWGARTGAETAPVEGVFEEPGTDRVDSVGVVRTDWPSQNVQDRSTKRNSFCVIKGKRAAREVTACNDQTGAWSHRFDRFTRLGVVK